MNAHETTGGNMTLQELYARTNSWTARHVVQDEINMYGKDDIASDYIIAKAARFDAAFEAAQVSANVAEHRVAVRP